MLSELFTFAVQNGLPQSTLLLLLLLPAVATLVIFFRVVIGVEYLQLSRAIFLSLGVASLGLQFGIFFFLLAIGLDLVGKMLLRNVRLLPQAKYSLILFFSLLVLLSLFLLAGYFTRNGFISLDILPILLIMVSAQGMLQLSLGDSLWRPLGWMIEMILFLCGGFFILTLPRLQTIALESPVIYGATLAVLMVVLGLFRGLRLNEFFRFFRVISNREP